ncbi:MAG: 50S ribosomal protein L25 [Actinomycetota bacterium]
MAEVKLKAHIRENTGKGSARQSRIGGRVPAVVYGLGMEPTSIEVDRREFVTALLGEAGMNVLIDLDVDGSTTLALTRELQRDPVKGTLLHADFVKIDRKQEVEVEVPVHLEGTPAGVDEGGVLEHTANSLHVRSLATKVPQFIIADVSALAIGESLRVSDLVIGDDYTVLNDPETVVASVSAPVSEAELEAMEADAGVVQEETDVEAEEGLSETPDAAGEEAAEETTEGGDES